MNNDEKKQAVLMLTRKLRHIATAFIEKQANRIVPSPDTITVDITATKTKIFNVTRKRREIDHEEALEIIEKQKQDIIDIKRHHKFEVQKLQTRIDFLENHPLHHAGHYTQELTQQLREALRKVRDAENRNSKLGE